MWQVTQNQWIIEITPLDDIKEHAMAYECWCVPAREMIGWHEQSRKAQIVFTHISADNRELGENRRAELIKELTER